MYENAYNFCVTCVRGVRRFTGNYRDFLFDPGTLFTIASGVLLLAAIIVNPSSIVSESNGGGLSKSLYFASAMVGSIFIWWSAVQGIRERDFTADIPVSIATAAAIIIGEYSAASVVAVLLLVGGMLEEFVAARAGKALESLARLLPDQVTVRRGNKDVIIPLEAVRTGDLLLIRSGERIAVDGEILSGTAAVNQAAITGESLAVDKYPGDTVYAGTLIDVGALEVRSTHVGDETTLGQIRRMIAEAQEQQAPIERLLDRYAMLYTPVALIFGALLWWWSGDMLRAITMLIVFCPCVMVLATPTALVASIGNAALRGNLVKKGATIEALAKVDTVVFDKTGTLTLGQPELVEAFSLNGLSETELLRSAAIAEKYSEHPIGRAIRAAAENQDIVVPDPDEFEMLPGLGVNARIDGQIILLGRSQLLAERGVSLPTDFESQISHRTSQGRSAVLVAIDQVAAGLLIFEDVLRPEAHTSVKELNELGLRTLLVSGDNQATADRIATNLGIQEVHAEVLPQRKVEIVKHLQAGSKRVLFVGDGVNDGPALATADVGIAMGVAGTDVAIETADIALLSDDLAKLPHLLGVSRQAIRAIKQNLIFSLAVLALAVGLTVPGILTPVTGALLHELSSIPVIMNSARLIGWTSRVPNRSSP